MEQETLLEFPCTFPIKAMGLSEHDFRAHVFDIILQYAPDLTLGDLKETPSRNGKYLSITAVIEAESQAQLDSIYEALSASKQVVMAL